MAIKDRVTNYIPGLRARRALTRPQALAVVPVHNSSLSWEKVEGGEIALRVPRRSDGLGRIMARMFRVPEHKEILLDEVGASVWEMCDGRHDIGGIITETSKKYKLNRREAEVSVTTYIKTLAERRLIGLTHRGGRVRHGRR